MSNRAMALADALKKALPKMNVMTAKYDAGIDKVDTSGGPVIVVADGVARGISLSAYGSETDDLPYIAAELYRAADKVNILMDDPQTPSYLSLMFRKMEPVIDESDFRIGECLHYMPLHHSQSTSA